MSNICHKLLEIIDENKTDFKDEVYKSLVDNIKTEFDKQDKNKIYKFELNYIKIYKLNQEKIALKPLTIKFYSKLYNRICNEFKNEILSRKPMLCCSSFFGILDEDVSEMINEITSNYEEFYNEKQCPDCEENIDCKIGITFDQTISIRMIDDE